MVIADPVAAIVTLITDNWVTGNVDDTTPSIDESWDLGKVNLQRGDVVRCYEVSGVHAPGTFGKSLDMGSWRVSIDMSTASSRSRLRKLYGEVIRILRANETSPGTDYALVRAISRNDLTDKQQRWFRYVLDVDLTSFEEVS